MVLELFPNLNPQCKLRFPFSAARWKSLKKCYWITLALFQLLFLGFAWQPRNAARQTSIPLHNLIDQLESVKTNRIFSNGSLSLTFQFFKAITHAHSFKKTVLLYIFFFSHLQLKLWFTLVIPDHLELCEKPVVGSKAFQLGFSLHGIAKFTPNWLKHNSGNRISSCFPSEGWIWIWNRINSPFC